MRHHIKKTPVASLLILCLIPSLGWAAPEWTEGEAAYQTVSQDASNARQNIQGNQPPATEDPMAHPFRFRIIFKNILQPGTVNSTGGTPFEVQFPNRLRLSYSPKQGLQVFFPSNPSPIELKGVSATYLRGALTLEGPGLCQMIFPDGLFILSTTCEASKYIATEKFAFDGDLPMQFWVIQIDEDGGPPQASLLRKNWNHYEPQPRNICWYGDTGKKDRSNNRLETCDLQRRTFLVSSTPDEVYLLEDGSMVRPMVLRSWITSKNPLP